MSFPATLQPRRDALSTFGLSARRVALAVAILFGSGAAFAMAIPASTFAWDPSSYNASSEAQLIALTNRSRTNAGLRALKVDATLRSVARWRSKDMIDRNYFAHAIPGYGKVFDKLDAIGYCYHVAGENIGWLNYPDDLATAEIHQMFMDSAPHRANILGKTWDAIGIGAYKGANGKKMWTVLFADRCGGSAPAATPKPAPRATPRATSKPKPAATPKPTAKPRPTPAPTAVPTLEPTADATSEPTSPLTGDPGLEPGGGPGPADGSTPEPFDPADASASDDTSGATAAVGLRVVDRGAPQGLVDAIVGDVTGFFFGG
jgi:uncharacterized protein YkwD